MQDKPQIIFLEDGYKIAIGDHESEEFNFGDMADLSFSGRTLYAVVARDEDDEDAEPYSMLGEHWIIEGKPIECDVVPLEEEEVDNVE